MKIFLHIVNNQPIDFLLREVRESNAEEEEKRGNSG